MFELKRKNYPISSGFPELEGIQWLLSLRNVIVPPPPPSTHTQGKQDLWEKVG